MKRGGEGSIERGGLETCFYSMEARDSLFWPLSEQPGVMSYTVGDLGRGGAVIRHPWFDLRAWGCVGLWKWRTFCGRG